MGNEVSRLQLLGEALTAHGTAIVFSLAILICGLLGARWLHNTIGRKIKKLYPENKAAPVACNSLYTIIVSLTILGTAVELGAQPVNMVRLTAIIVLIIIGVMVFLRPILPTLPFKVGNYVKAGELLGKVEAITFLNTQMRTFDGKTFFVPNRQILNEVVINYHFTQTRRVKINVTIRYDENLIKVKQILETVMIEDPRVKHKPSPVVYVMNLGSSGVDLGGRCWVANKDFWIARCDLLEKTKIRFDNEGIRFAFSQLDLHIQSNEWVIDEKLDEKIDEIEASGQG